MTDLEIDRALALAIGWKPAQMWKEGFNPSILMVQRREGCFAWPFSHKDWNVIGPIAEQYNMFPYRLSIGKERGKWNVLVHGKDYVEDTPQKAIALAVIGAVK